MKEIINKLLLARNKPMSEMNLKQPRCNYLLKTCLLKTKSRVL